MTNSNPTTTDPHPGLIIQEHIKLTNWYESYAQMILTYPLLINASAAIALASFFTHNNPPLYAKPAIFSFICGVLFGILTLILEFITPYVAVTHFVNHFFKDYKNDANVLKERYATYCFKRHERMMTTINIRIVNGILAILCCFIGIFFIVNDIAGKHLILISGLSILFLIYSAVVVYLIIQKLKPPIEQESIK